MGFGILAYPLRLVCQRKNETEFNNSRVRPFRFVAARWGRSCESAIHQAAIARPGLQHPENIGFQRVQAPVE